MYVYIYIYIYIYICTFLCFSGKIFHNLGPKYDKVSDLYRILFIPQATKSEVFLRLHSWIGLFMGKTLFIILGEQLFCTLYISVTNNWRFFTFTVTELTFSKSSLKVNFFYLCELNALSWTLLMLLFRLFSHSKNFKCACLLAGFHLRIALNLQKIYPFY